MTDPQGADRSTGTQLRRYGPIVAIAVVIAIVAVVAVVSGGGDGGETATDNESPDVDEVGAPEPTGSMPVTYDEAVEAGEEDDHEWGDQCDPETGKVRIPSVYAAPCVPVFEGDNGGETSPGVSADTIKIVRYQGQAGSDLTALLGAAGVQDTPEQIDQTFRDYMEIYSSVLETYGREFEIVTFDGTGAFDDEVASKADAVKIAEELEPFAVMGGPILDGGAFAIELASRGIVCMGCALANPDSVIQEHAPYLWGTNPSPDQFILNLQGWLESAAEQLGEEDLAAVPAEYAGPGLQDEPRQIGVVHLEQDPPVFEETASEGQLLFGQEDAPRETYLLDLATMPDRANQIVARFKDAGITTIVFVGDFIMPTYLSQAATEQEYFPEWLLTGPGFWDTDVIARTFDQEQWGRAWGLTNLSVGLPQEETQAWTLYEWYFGEGTGPPPANATFQLIQPGPFALTLAIHMAGPDLTPDTFARGMFRVPPMGGGPTTPQISFGNWGFFPETDYFAIDDSAEVWWDPDARGLDRIGQEGVGLYRFTNGGERFTSKNSEASAPFVDEGSVTRLDEPPPEDQAPDYPPPQGSPAASG